MRNLTYLRYEVLRTVRNRRFLFFSLCFPLVLMLFLAVPNQSKTLDGISFPLYYMTGMAAWGSTIAIISSGGRIASERQIGWARQLRTTPLGTRTYFVAKVACGYLMALLTIAVLYIAGSALGVRLSTAQWVTMTALLLIGLAPFAVLGIMLGHLLRPDSLGPAVGGIAALFSLLGGAWGPLSDSRTFVDIVKCIPSYWLVQAGKVARGRSGWLPVEGWVVLVAWSVVLGCLAVLAYRRDTSRAS